jgi:hypothetical protein
MMCKLPTRQRADTKHSSRYAKSKLGRLVELTLEVIDSNEERERTAFGFEQAVNSIQAERIRLSNELDRAPKLE